MKTEGEALLTGKEEKAEIKDPVHSLHGRVRKYYLNP